MRPSSLITSAGECASCQVLTKGRLFRSSAQTLKLQTIVFFFLQFIPSSVLARSIIGGIYLQREGNHGNCFLSHQRLAIVDPTSGNQPLYNEDKTIVVTVNGEIYNHEELRKKTQISQVQN